MDTKKIITALTYIAWKQDDHIMDNMKAFKLLWLADRYQLRNIGRSVTGDVYYAMPHGLVPSDAKCLLDNEKTKLPSDKNYKDKYIKSLSNHTYCALSAPDTDEFSESDIKALDLVWDKFGSWDSKALSDFSHTFPEWTYYQGMIEDRDAKSSYRVCADHFFEPAECDNSGIFNQSDELLSLTKELYHQYNRY